MNKVKSSINTIELEVKKLQSTNIALERAAALSEEKMYDDVYVEMRNNQDYARKILTTELEKPDTNEGVEANECEQFIGDCEYLN